MQGQANLVLPGLTQCVSLSTVLKIGCCFFFVLQPFIQMLTYKAEGA